MAGAGSVLDDGYRNAAEFLRARLRIDIREARRRLTQAALLLPGTSLTGETTSPRHEHLATAFAATDVPSRSATIITTALERVAFIAHPDTLTTMEHALTRTATHNDPDFLAKTAQHWINRIDHDGPEPTEEELRTIQGAFIRKPRRGLHHIEIFVTDEQYETLITTMNTATNPRLTPHSHPNTPNTAGHNTPNTTNSPGTTASPSAATSSVSNTSSVNSVSVARVTGHSTPGPELDRRSRAQKLLDGLITGCTYALRTGKLPANGGLKPQLTVTINASDLYPQLQNPPHHPGQPPQPGTPSPQPAHPTQGGSSVRPGSAVRPGSSLRPGSATATFTGPIHASTIRKIACDADILPVLLGTNGQILDIGRTTRIFPPHIRKAIAARDQGCTFPDCTIPAPWCEAHHITYWSQGGTTSTNNGTLLCSHHHHLIHKEQWKITTHQGIPWFTPPPHIDPTQTPQRNHHHTPHRT
ncbi:HNH endonuclease signature motif containing protein [Paenarthrobacter ureafaciens]|uniref:HNH endonuclease signature motif containing protein n=2 Tax=Paenarthrobacter ureafaciens TaxID=37931 RepID=UPI00296EE9D4